METKGTTLYEQEPHSSSPSPSEAQRLPASAMHVPWWSSPFFGYPACVIFVAVALFFTMLIEHLTSRNQFPTVLFFLATVLVALFWGVGPALLAILLGFISLDIFVISPQGLSIFSNINNLTIYIPFLLAGLVVTLITSQREAARKRAIAASQRERARSEELARVNATLLEANRELEHANQLKDQFLSRASHELKTPIAAISAQAQLGLYRLNKQPELPDSIAPLRTQLERVHAQTHRLQALVDDLLNLSSFRSGKLPLHISQCDFAAICREVVEDQQMLSARRIALDLPDSPLTVYGDRERLAQVVINLVTNAVKYAATGSAIYVAIRQEAGHLLLLVHNDRPYIPQEQQAHLFEPFYRSTGALSSKQEGWGLGLAISKEIVEQHDGSIWLESTEEKGTTFFVKLPLTQHVNAV